VSPLAWKARGTAKPEPIMRPRLYNIAHQWDKWTRGCSDVEYVTIAKVEMEIGKSYCDRYSQ
jgi:hypothetical protein